MTTTQTDGLRFQAKAPSKSRYWRTAALLFGMCAALWGAICSMLREWAVWPFCLAGSAVVFLLPVLRKRRGWLLLPALAFVAVVLLGWESARSGVLLGLNRLFIRSAAEQAYEYDLFALTLSAQAETACMRIAAALLSAAIGLGCLALSSAPGLVGLLGFGGFALSVAYLGVSPAFGWIVAVAAFSVALSVRGGFWPAIFALAVVALTCYGLYPQELPAVSRVDDILRDQLALHTVAYQTLDPVQTPSEAPQQTPDPPRPSSELPQTVPFVWTSTMTLILIIVVVLLILFVPAIFQDRRRKRLAANRAGWDGENCADAISAMFVYVLKWFPMLGLRPGNIPFRDYPDYLATQLPQEFVNSFSNILPLWQEAAFSSHPMTEAQRGAMRDYLSDFTAAMWARATRLQRLRIRYQKALY